MLGSVTSFVLTAQGLKSFEIIAVEAILFPLLLQPRLGDVELRSTTTKIIADLHVDSISQHSNMPLFRLTHQFVTMFYCARDAQNSAERRRNLIVCKAAFDAKGEFLC